MRSVSRNLVRFVRAGVVVFGPRILHEKFQRTFVAVVNRIGLDLPSPFHVRLAGKDKALDRSRRRVRCSQQSQREGQQQILQS